MRATDLHIPTVLDLSISHWLRSQGGRRPTSPSGGTLYDRAPEAAYAPQAPLLSPLLTTSPLSPRRSTPLDPRLHSDYPTSTELQQTLLPSRRSRRHRHRANTRERPETEGQDPQTRPAPKATLNFARNSICALPLYVPLLLELSSTETYGDYCV